MMFVILAYDVAAKRTGKVMKTVKKYLRVRQRSVFEGFITEGKLNELKRELESIIDCERDSIVVYRLASSKYVLREELGKAVDSEQQFL